MAHLPREGEVLSGDNYTYSEEIPGQVIMSVSDGMGSGEQAFTESRRVVELAEQLLETGFSARAALKMVNTVLMLTGEEQHPATLDLCCVDLHTGVLEAMKLGAVATFVLNGKGVEVLEAGEVPAGVLGDVEPVLLSKKLWDGDRIIMVTDGVLEACPGENKEGSLGEYIESMNVGSVQKMADEILEFAASHCEKEIPRDDMMVLVGGIWKR